MKTYLDFVDLEIKNLIKDFNDISFANTFFSCAGYGLGFTHKDNPSPAHEHSLRAVPYLVVRYDLINEYAWQMHDEMSKIWNRVVPCGPDWWGYKKHTPDKNVFISYYGPQAFEIVGARETVIKELWDKTHAIVNKYK